MQPFATLKYLALFPTLELACALIISAPSQVKSPGFVSIGSISENTDPVATRFPFPFFSLVDTLNASQPTMDLGVRNSTTKLLPVPFVPEGPGWAIQARADNASFDKVFGTSNHFAIVRSQPGSPDKFHDDWAAASGTFGTRTCALTGTVDENLGGLPVNKSALENAPGGVQGKPVKSKHHGGWQSGQKIDRRGPRTVIALTQTTALPKIHHDLQRGGHGSPSPSTMTLSPGIRFLWRPLSISLLLLAAGYAANIPPHLGLVYTAVGVPSFAVLWISAARILQHSPRESTRGRWPGNLDIVTDLRRAWNVSYPLEVLRELILASHANTLNLRIGWDDYILTTEPDYIKIILATDFSNYVKGDALRECMGSVLGTGVFNSDGEMWKFHRAATRPFFNRDRISDFEIFAHHADRAIERMKERMRAGYAVDFQDLAGRFTMDAATAFLFGSCVDSLAAPLPYPASGPSPFSAPASPAHSDVFTAAGDATRAPMRVVDAYLEPIIAATVRKGAAGKEKDAAPETLLDELLNLISDPKVLKDEMLNILLAGRDTTMSVLTTVVYFLSVYPAVCTRLARRDPCSAWAARGIPLTRTSARMKYLRAVINETMRLYPPVPSNLRENCPRNDLALAKPRPAAIIHSRRYQDLLLRLPNASAHGSLGAPPPRTSTPTASSTRASRTHVLVNPFCFLPFNAGPRVCLGQQFAYNEISFMLIRLLQSFAGTALDPEACPPHARVPPEWRHGHGRMSVERFRPRLHLTLSSEGGLWVKMTESVDGEVEV
ncbi:cytochrome P450 [Mycena vulgaris]|nr:cytochrome P450 [Mycena vulgaris]